jgi:hypothetical protein
MWAGVEAAKAAATAAAALKKCAVTTIVVPSATHKNLAESDTQQKLQLACAVLFCHWSTEAA